MLTGGHKPLPHPTVGTGVPPMPHPSLRNCFWVQICKEKPKKKMLFKCKVLPITKSFNFLGIYLLTKKIPTYFVYQNYFIRTFHTIFFHYKITFLIHKMEHKFKRLFCTQKPVWNVHFWYTKKSESTIYNKLYYYLIVKNLKIIVKYFEFVFINLWELKPLISIKLLKGRNEGEK
jgi:hypothetical protein